MLVTLLTSDNQSITARRDAILQSAVIRNMVEDLGEANQPIPLDNVSSEVLFKILEFCEHVILEPTAAPASESSSANGPESIILQVTGLGELSEWEKQYITTVSESMLMQIVTAADFLEIPPLVDIGCKGIIFRMRGSTPAECRRLFDIRDSFPKNIADEIDLESLLNYHAN